MWVTPAVTVTGSALVGFCPARCSHSAVRGQRQIDLVDCSHAHLHRRADFGAGAVLYRHSQRMLAGGERDIV